MSKNTREKNRELTEQEKKRTERTEKTVQSYVDNGYSVTELTIGIVKANLMSLIVCLPVIAIFVLWWFLRNTFSHEVMSTKPLTIVVSLIIITVVHELIHAFFWGVSAPGHFKSIELGFVKEMMTPYCACLEPLTKTQYIIGSVAPGVILGIIPCVIAVLTANFSLFLFGIIGFISGGGDYQIDLKLLGYKSDKESLLCLDHPTKVGLMVLEK